MAGKPATETTRDAPQSARHVLHVADSEVLARFSLMFAQALPVLCANGWRVSLLTNDQNMPARFDDTPLECHPVTHLTGWRGRRLPELLSARFGPPPDIVHLWGTVGLRAVRHWTGPRHVPLLIHAVGQRDVDHMLSRGLRPNEQLAAMSAGLLQPLLQRFPLAADVCHTIPPAVALPIRPTRQRSDGRTLSVLCVAHLDAHAGLETMIEATARLRQREHDLQVAAVGCGPGPRGVWELIRSQHVQDCVTVIDEPLLWEQVLPEVDVCVVPACQQELWLAPLLAMGLGKVVIASRDQIAEWFVEQRTAWQFTPGSAVELAYLLARVLEQPKLTAELCEQACAYVRGGHAIGELVTQLVALYQSMAAGRATPAAPNRAESNRGGDRD